MTRAEIQLDPNAVIAAVRECARITSPDTTDSEFEEIRAANDPIFARTVDEISRTIRAYLGSLPFLPVQGAVKKLEWEMKTEHGKRVYFARGAGYLYEAWAKAYSPGYTASISIFGNSYVVADCEDLEDTFAAAQADYEARILSALEPSAGRAAVLEEAARVVDAKAEEYEKEARDLRGSDSDRRFCSAVAVRLRGSANEIRALHPVADKPDEAGAQGEGWLPIESAPKDGTIIHVWANGFQWPETVKWLDFEDDEQKAEVGADGYWTFTDELLADVADGLEPEQWTHWRPLPTPPSSEVA